MQEIFATPRLRAEPAADCDLDRLLDVYLSHPEVLELTEGSDGTAGLYDRGMLERDLALAELDPDRTSAALLADGVVVGTVDWIERHPERGFPWIGMLLIHASHQRRGYGSEAMAGVLAHGAARGWREVGAGVPAVDQRGAAFLRTCGFTCTGSVSRRFAAGLRDVLLFEREVEPAGGISEGGERTLAVQDEAHQVE